VKTHRGAQLPSLSGKRNTGQTHRLGMHPPGLSGAIRSPVNACRFARGLALAITACLALHPYLLNSAEPPPYGCGGNPTGNPIGGGPGYSDIFTGGDSVVRNADELLRVLKAAERGDVIFVPGDAAIDLTGHKSISVPAGVTLAGDRGRNGSAGARIFTSLRESHCLMLSGGEECRLTGLRFEGAYGGTELVADHSTFFQVRHYGVEVDNCEIYNFNVTGVRVGSGAIGVRIHHNSIHHCQRSGYGYGVVVGEGTASITANIFDYCRHHVAASGPPGCSYECAWYLILEHATSTCFDMHGGRDRGDGTDIAGDWMHIHHNTFRSTRHAVGIRGRPAQGAEIHDNWFSQQGPGRNVIFPWPPTKENGLQVFNNAYGLDTPRILDPRHETWQDALAAGRRHVSAKRYKEGGAHFAEALRLAANPDQRAKARLELARCLADRGLISKATAEYQAILALKDVPAAHMSTAQRELAKLEEQATTQRAVTDWRLAFSDDFERDELGSDWQVLNGTWRIRNGTLTCPKRGGSEIIVARRFPGCHRIEFEAKTDDPCDLSSFVQAGTAGLATGYFMQFGGVGNKLNALRRAGVDGVRHDVTAPIRPGHVHKMVAEFDGNTARLTVDGEVVLALHDEEPLVGPANERVGFYIYRTGEIDNVRVYTGRAVSNADSAKAANGTQTR